MLGAILLILLILILIGGVVPFNGAPLRGAPFYGFGWGGGGVLITILVIVLIVYLVRGGL